MKTRKELLRTIKYVLVSASAGLIQMGSNALLEWIFGETTDGEPLHAVFYAIALTLSVIWNCTINRRYTFKSASNLKRAILLALLFYVFFGPFSYWFDHYLTAECGWHWFFATGLNMLINLALEFPYQRFFIFRKSIDTNDLAKSDVTVSKEEAVSKDDDSASESIADSK